MRNVGSLALVKRSHINKAPSLTSDRLNKKAKINLSFVDLVNLRFECFFGLLDMDNPYILSSWLRGPLATCYSYSTQWNL